MTERVQIEIEASDNASGILRAITSQFGALGGVVSDFGTSISANAKFMGLYSRAMKDGSVSAGELEAAQNMANAASARLAETVAMFAIQTLRDSINATMEYAGQVRDLALASGTSAEEASRLIQVLDDYEISANNISTATRFLTKNGLEPNIETIAKLADEYVKLETPLEKNRFLVDNLGRGGREWALALSQGGDKLRELNGEVSNNLILTDEQIRQTEEYRLSLDEMSDTWDGVQVKIGTMVIPLLNTLAEEFSRELDIMQQQIDIIDNYTNKAAIMSAVLGPLGQIYADLNPKVESSVRYHKELTTAAPTAAAGLDASGEAAARASEGYRALVDMAERLNEATAEQIKQAAYQDLKANLTSEESAGGKLITAEEKKLLEDAGVALGIMSEESIKASDKIKAFNEMLEDGVLTVDGYRQAVENLGAAMENIDGASVDISAGSSGTEGVFGNATGTGGQWVTVPAGYPNDSYKMGLSSGEKYQVQTQAESGAGDTVNNTSAVNNYYGNITMVTDGGFSATETRI